MRITGVALAMVILATGTASAQNKASGANPAATGITNVYNTAKGYILRAAEQVPEARYTYQPTKDVRTFGQIIGHIVDSQQTLCSSAKGSETPYSDVTEKTVTKKTDLIAKLRQSFAACDAVYSGATDAMLSNKASVFGSPASVSQALTMNASHNWEHYGNLVTYMRLMGMVPPSSQQ